MVQEHESRDWELPLHTSQQWLCAANDSSLLWRDCNMLGKHLGFLENIHWSPMEWRSIWLPWHLLSALLEKLLGRSDSTVWFAQSKSPDPVHRTAGYKVTIGLSKQAGCWVVQSLSLVCDLDWVENGLAQFWYSPFLEKGNKQWMASCDW